MRTLLCAVLTFTLTLPAGAAFAQSETEMRADDSESEEGLAPMEEEGEARAAPSGREDAPGASHTVERGDTLWDLSQRYLGSPWYWPKVWSYNPEIANPHWIYPGNVVRFFSTGEEVPTQVEVGEEPEEVADVEEGAMYTEEDKVRVAGKIGYVPKGALSLPATSFITTREVEEAGVIAGSFAEADLLSFPMTIYVSFREQRTPRMGEQYVIFRSAGEVTHPVTLTHVGYMTKIVGKGKVIRWDKDSEKATLEVIGQYDDILRGDLVGPMGEPIIVSTAARPNETDISGAYVVSATSAFLTTFGEHSLIIIDRGADDGVKVGNIFSIWRQNDNASQEQLMNPTIIDERWPKEDVGACMAFDVKSKFTTCVVVKSLREIVKGDHVEMRSTRARSAAR